MAKMVVYHGSYTKVDEPNIIKGNHTKDFGDGFYCTIIREQAQKWASRYTKSIVNSYNVIMNEKLKVKEFSDMTEDWLDFIINSRAGVPHDYDIVIGAMADDQIYTYISDYIDGTITREQFWILAKFKYPTHQITFCTENALKCLTFIGCEEVLSNEWKRK